jgi:hypothetical protein
MPLGVHLVTGDGEQIDAPGPYVDGNLPGRLGGVGMEEHAAAMGNARQFGEGLQHTGLVVCCHDRHQHGIRGEGLCQRGRVDSAVLVNRQIPHVYGVQPLQRAAGLQNGWMLSGLGDDPCRRGPVMGECDAAEREICPPRIRLR